MEITEVRVFPVHEDKLKAFASIVIDDAFVVSDIKIIDGKTGRFLSMPATRRKNGTFRDIAHPLNNETRRMIEERVFQRYDEVLAERILGHDIEDVDHEAAHPEETLHQGLPAARQSGSHATV
jgi:stage V sporulation protein G